MRLTTLALATIASAAGCGPGESSSAQAPPPEPQEKTVYVLMTTSMGEIVLELDRQKAPISVDNFVAYAQKQQYDGTIFHRVIEKFMIQGGGFTPELAQRPTGPPIRNEWTNGLKNARGTIAMARTNDPDSATAQFFINVVDNLKLDEPRPSSGGAGYAVFGRVAAGMDVVDEIRVVKTGLKKGMQDVPIQDVLIEQVRVIGAGEAKKRIGAG